MKVETKKRKHRLRNLDAGQTLINNFFYSERKQENKKFGTLMKNQQSKFRKLANVDERTKATGNKSEKYKSCTIKNVVEFGDDSDVEIIGEYISNTSDKLHVGTSNKRKRYKNNNLKEPKEFDNDSDVEVIDDIIYFGKSDCSSVKEPNSRKCEKEFTFDVAHEADDTMKKSFSIGDGRVNHGENVDSSTKIVYDDVDLHCTDVNVVNKNLICDDGKKLINSELTIRCVRIECVENHRSAMADVAKVPDIFPENNNSSGGTQTKSECWNNCQIESEYNNRKQFSTGSEHNQALCICMMHVTENNHDHAYRRLNMLFPSFCSLQPFICYKHHEQPKTSSLSECMCEYHFLEGEWDEAIEGLESLISKTTCPDWKIITYSLAYMCETGDVENLSTCYEILTSLVSRHPPCYRPNYYLKIFTQAVEMQSLKNGGISKDGIFRDVLFNLQQFVKSTKISEGLVYGLEEESTSNGNIENQCLVMELMVGILEANLSVWLPRRGFNPKTALLKDANCPLVVKLLWWNNKHGGLERFSDIRVFKPVIDLYVSSFCKAVPSKLKHIASRLLALIAEVKRACDFDENATYPHFGRHSKELAHAIHISISDQSASMIQKIIQGLSPSWLKMLVCCNCLSCFITNTIVLQRLEFVINCKKVAEHQSKQCNSARTNARGETRLHVLCRNKRLKELEELLLDPTVDVNVADYAGWTPLHEAVFKGHVENVQTLIMYRPPGTEGGVNLRPPGDGGTTPLMEAAEGGHTSLCRLLLKYGGISLLEDKQENGKTAWDLAKSPDVITVLEKCVKCFESGNARFSTKPSQTVVFKCAPTQGFWNLLSLFSYSYIDTFMLKDHLCHTAIGCCTLAENRDGKVRLTYDADRLVSDMLVLEQVLQFLMSCRFNVHL